MIRIFLDTWVPSGIRDTYWFMYPFAFLAFGRHASTFLNFRKNAFSLTPAEYERIYKKVNLLFTRETDLTEACRDAIEHNIVGGRILEVGCGRGYLAKRLSATYRVTACDIVLDPGLRGEKNMALKQASIEHLPFTNRSFDTVICTHTLEHVLDIDQAVAELRRVTKKRLIIVVPMQKPFLYTLDLHLHFFPYPFSLVATMKHGMGKHFACLGFDGDLFYYEDR